MRYNDSNALTMSSNISVAGSVSITDSFSSPHASSYAYFTMGSSGVETGVANATPVLTSLSAQHAIQASQFIALSDRRVKTHVVDADTDAITEALRTLPVKTWAYKDTLQHGKGRRLGFIAQDLPPALSQFAIAEHADFIPDVFQHATLSQGRCTYSLPGHGLVKGDIIRYCTSSQTGKASILDVITPDTFTIDTELEPTIFVYGKYARDIKSIDYDALVAALVASHQSLEKRLASLEKK